MSFHTQLTHGGTLCPADQIMLPQLSFSLSVFFLTVLLQDKNSAVATCGSLGNSSNRQFLGKTRPGIVSIL